MDERELKGGSFSSYTHTHTHTLLHEGIDGKMENGVRERKGLGGERMERIEQRRREM